MENRANRLENIAHDLVMAIEAFSTLASAERRKLLSEATSEKACATVNEFEKSIELLRQLMGCSELRNLEEI